MVFSSITFIFFLLPIFLLLYKLTPFHFRNGVILVFSLIFYAWSEPVYIILMILETFSDYCVGRKLESCNSKGRRKLLLGYSLVVDLGILAFFKYADFIIETLNHLGLTIKPLNLPLPIGISFFTFQSLSYVIDMYKGEIEAEHSYLSYLTYVSMFPQLVAGPIVRFSTVQKELHSRLVTGEDFCDGFLRFLRGLFKKVLLANQIGVLYEQINSMAATASVAVMWLGAIAYTFQIYYDFSGYSDMAIGLGRIMGFHFDENFKHPLVSTSITDFWRRWHISLSTWFRNYVYIPLGGNRTSAVKHLRNILIVWMLTGLWHGASWNFVLWGLYYGILLILEKKLWGAALERLPKLLRVFYSFVLVVLGFVIFSHDDMGSLILYFKGLMAQSGNAIYSPDFMWFIKNNIWVIAGCFIFSRSWEKLRKSLQNKKLISVITMLIYVGLFLLSLAYLVNDSYNPFLYFRF